MMSATTRLRERGNRFPPDVWALIALVGVVLAANAVSMLRITDPNPLGPLSGLSVSQPGFVLGHSSIDPNIGFTVQALGRRAMLDLIHGHLPWWNPFEGTGTALAGEMQSGAFFPPSLLLLIGNGQLYERMLLELLAGYATYRLLRRLELSFWACLAGGIAFALNGTFAWLQNAAFNPVAFLPLALLGIERARAAVLAGRAGGWRLLALALVLSVLAGFPETTYLDAMMVIVWLLWRLASSDFDRAQRRAFAVRVLRGGICAGLLAAPLLIAFADFNAHANLGINAGDENVVHLQAIGIGQLVMPYLYGPIFRFSDAAHVMTTQWDDVGGYLTTVLLLLGLCGLFARQRLGLRLVLLVWIVLVFAKAYGQIPLLGHVLSSLPGMTHLLFFRYSTPMLELSVIVLAALGLDDLIRAPRWRVLASMTAICLAVLAAIWKATPTFRQAIAQEYGDKPYAHASILWAVGTLVAFVVTAVLVRRPALRGVALVAILSADVLGMFVFPELSAPRSVSLDRAPVHYLSAHLGTERFFTLGPFEPNYGSYYGLSSLNMNDAPVPRRFDIYISQHLNSVESAALFTGTFGGPPGTTDAPVAELESHLSGYRAASVAYVLSPPHPASPLPRRSFVLVDTTPTTWIYRLKQTTPLISSPSGSCSTRVSSVTAAVATCRSASTLVYHETSLPGWSATVDGHGVSVRSDGLFLRIRVPAGRHRVAFTFRPPGIIWGELAFVLGVLGLLAPRGWRNIDKRVRLQKAEIG